GFRPLVLGRLPRGWVVASETAALDIVGATFVREIEPGELIAVDERGVRSRRFAAARPRGCLFEYVYLAGPDTSISGRSVQAIRERGIRLKLNPRKDVIAGQRIVAVDDSIVRGNTQRAIVTMLREAGAAEVHIRISSPPVAWPCFFGIDFASRAELIAGSLS